MYSPKRRFRLFRHPAWAGTTGVQYTWTEQISSPTQTYGRLVVSSDFTTQISTRQSSVSGGQGPYISADGGATWTRKVNGMTFLTNGGSYSADVTLAKQTPSVMYSANRRDFVSTLPSTYDKIYKSTNGGDNWTAISPADSTWQSIDCSYDGTIILAGNSNSGNATYDRKLSLSTDGGSTWTAVGPTGQWGRIAMNSTGTLMYAVESGGSRLYRSTNSGSTWSITSPTGIRSVACSADGLTLILGRNSTIPIVSTDGGATFTPITTFPNAFWGAVGISDNGEVMAVGGDNTASKIYVSSDSGTTWLEQTDSPTTVWRSIDINSDGTSIAAGGNTIKLYVGTPPT